MSYALPTQQAADLAATTGIAYGEALAALVSVSNTIREAQAEALEAAARELPRDHGGAARYSWVNYTHWLRDRAKSIREAPYV